tara:strand:+ start:235 stop:939 length:705 start_codon:yes stop_codon:yes gene_type:complete
MQHLTININNSQRYKTMHNNNSLYTNSLLKDLITEYTILHCNQNINESWKSNLASAGLSALATVGITSSIPSNNPTQQHKSISYTQPSNHFKDYTSHQYVSLPPQKYHHLKRFWAEGQNWFDPDTTTTQKNTFYNLTTQSLNKILHETNLNPSNLSFNPTELDIKINFYNKKKSQRHTIFIDYKFLTNTYSPSSLKFSPHSSISNLKKSQTQRHKEFLSKRQNLINTINKLYNQ